MSKSIPLKEIVGFLPYGLKVMHTEFEPEGAFTQEAEIVTISTECICFEAKWGASDYYFNEPDCEIKPIVRPLSDLTKEITHNGETFVPIEEIAKIHIDWTEFDSNLKVKYTFQRQCNLEISWNHPTQKESFFNDNLFIMNERINQNKYWVIEKLYEYHFDIYDWIKDGLAIDINTL